MFALRLARAATGRDAVLKFEGGFHGNNDYALMSPTPQERRPYPLAEPASLGIPDVLEDQVLIAPFNDLDTTERIVSENQGRLAAIIVEPMQRAFEPVPGFLEGLRRLADRHGMVLIFDEVVTGFRLALGGAQEYYGVVPDLATYGKILGGGYPLAMVGGKRTLMDALVSAPSEPGVYVSGTLSGNPVAAAAGLATIDVLSRGDAYSRLTAVGKRLRREIEAAFKAADIPASVIGAGPMFQIVLSATAPRNYRELAATSSAGVSLISQHMIDSGVLFTGRKGYVSLAHTDEDIASTLAAFENCASALRGRLTASE
jgi:glutamate-1-semialdehyde 2,1-aminomutase